MAALHLSRFSMASSQGPWSELVLPGTLSVASGFTASEYRPHTHSVSVLQSPALASLDLSPRFQHGSSMGVVTSCRHSLVSHCGESAYHREACRPRSGRAVSFFPHLSSSVISLPTKHCMVYDSISRFSGKGITPSPCPTPCLVPQEHQVLGLSECRAVLGLAMPLRPFRDTQLSGSVEVHGHEGLG